MGFEVNEKKKYNSRFSDKKLPSLEIKFTDFVLWLIFQVNLPIVVRSETARLELLKAVYLITKPSTLHTVQAKDNAKPVICVRVTDDILRCQTSLQRQDVG